MTRRQFVKESLNLKSELSNTNDFIKSILMTGEIHPQFDTLNDLHDKVYEIEKQIELLENRFERRAWSHQDFVLHSLIMNNID